MKKRQILLVVLAAVLAVAIAAGALLHSRLEKARHLYAASQRVRATLHKMADKSYLTVTEDGELIGDFFLEDLRTESPGALIDALFLESERRTVDEFAKDSIPDQLRWYRAACSEPQPWYKAATEGAALTLPLDAAHWDFTPVFDALHAKPRTAPIDAEAYLVDGRYEIMHEEDGTTLNEQAVAAALVACVSEGSAELNMELPLEWLFDVTDCDCYEHPAVTRTSDFDYDAILQEEARGLTIEVDTRGEKQTISILDYVSMQANRLTVDSEKLTEQIAAWAEETDEHDVHYQFASEDRGAVEIPFITCSYTLDQQALEKQLTKQLQNLETRAIVAPVSCTDEKGEKIALDETYIAVDKKSQTVTFYKDGRRIVHSDVVTGMPWGGHDTPVGLYDVVNKETDCWLSGPDFYVHVDYWVGFIGTLYGLHDADWRDEEGFGGEIYQTNGSHGCVNTPKEAMLTIFENAEPGMPVIVFD